MKRLNHENKFINVMANQNINMFKGIIDKLGQQGRSILKDIESYKFQLEQSARLTANDPVLTQTIIKKKKELDKAAAQIYSIVFDIENIDITKAYQQQNDSNQTNINNENNNIENIDEKNEDKENNVDKENDKDNKKEDDSTLENK